MRTSASLSGLCFPWLAALCSTGVSFADETPAPGESAAGQVEFVMHRVGTFRSEACGVGDFDNDGRPDIVAGPYLYPAPEWKARKIRTLRGEVDAEGKGYYWDFMNVPLDVDGDGLLDVVSCSWHGKSIAWYRNTGPEGGQWPRQLVEENGQYEHGDLWDIDGDGRRREILPGVLETVWYEVGTRPDGTRGLLKHVVSPKSFDWGVGAGDVNGDGRPDVLRPGAWFEAPADPRRGPWKEHPLAVGSRDQDKPAHTPQICVADVDADGRNDIVTSSAHGYGIFWYRQIPARPEIAWQEHLIDDSWTQAHALVLADLDADGDPDLVTGKRFMAHDGNDPDAYGPLGVYWYELRPGPSPVWKKHALSYDRGIGAGLNIPVADLDDDGDPDLVVTGKWGGPVWFENRAMQLVLAEFDGRRPNGTWDVHQFPGSFPYQVNSDALIMTDCSGANQHLTRRGFRLDPKSRYIVQTRFTIREPADAKAPNSFCLNLNVAGEEGSLDSISCWSINLDVAPGTDPRGAMKYMGFVDGRFRQIGQRIVDWSRPDVEYLLRVEVNTDRAGRYKFKTLTVTVREGNKQRERFEVDYSPFPYQPDFSRPVRLGVNTHGADWAMRDLKVYARRGAVRS